MKIKGVCIILLLVSLSIQAQDFAGATWNESAKEVFQRNSMYGLNLVSNSPNELQYGEYRDPNNVWWIYTFIEDQLSLGTIVMEVARPVDPESSARYQLFLQYRVAELGKPDEMFNDPTDISEEASGPVLTGWHTERSLIYYILVEDHLGRWTQYQFYIPNTDKGMEMLQTMKENFGF